MEASVKKSILLQSLKAGLFSLVFSCIGVLVLALLAKLFNISDGALPIINQILKVIAVVIGMLLCVKNEKFIVKALIGALIYWVLSFVLFSLLGGAFHWGQIFLDLGLALVASVVIALIKSKRA
ncbi:MAG: hypothetical protein NC132_01355 [Corallococcus sp.]|nr:hypothetical protein [Corallococcus sp.]MCM1359441.1 hypothetical protein [Corallococcus sp.]MCM1394747.1 hypothetical protein [Corallococcus sp.]